MAHLPRTPSSPSLPPYILVRAVQMCTCATALSSSTHHMQGSVCAGVVKASVTSDARKARSKASPRSPHQEKLMLECVSEMRAEAPKPTPGPPLGFLFKAKLYLVLMICVALLTISLFQCKASCACSSSFSFNLDCFCVHSKFSKPAPM